MWMSRHFLAFMAVVGLPLAAMCQAAGLSSTGPAAAQAIEAARKIYDQQGPRAALPELERLLARFEQAGDHRSEAITLGMMSNCYRRFNQFPKALELAQRGLAINKGLGDLDQQGKSYNQLGLIYWSMADYPRATQNLRQAIDFGRRASERVLEASALNNLGLVEDEQGDYRNSSRHYQQALELDRATGFKRGESDVLGNLGGVKMLLGRFNEAIPFYQDALKLDVEGGLKPGQSVDLGNLAICYSATGKTTEALAVFDRALKLAGEAGLARDQADWHRGKGDAFEQAGKYQEALMEYGEAQQVYEKAGLKRELVDTLNGSGNLYLLLGDVVSGERAFRRAFDLASSIHNEQGIVLNLLSLGEIERRKSHFREATRDFTQAKAMARQAGDLAGEQESLVQLAQTLKAQGQLKAAEQAAERALAVAGRMQNPPAEAESLLTLGDIFRVQHRWTEAMQKYDAALAIEKTFADPELGWRLAYGLGQALEGLGKPDEAVKKYEAAISLIEAVRAQLGEERYRAGYLQDRYQVYVALVDLLLRLHRTAEAFFYSERLRARSYLDQLGLGRPASDSIETARQLELRERIQQLRRAIEQEWSQPQERQRQKRALETFSAELEEAERAYQSLLDQSGTFAPAMAAPAAAEVQRDLEAGSALLEYVVGPRRLYILLIRRQQIQAVTVPVGEQQLESRIELLRYFITQPGSDQWRPPAAGLRRLLVDAVESQGWLHGVRKLYLSPDGVLNYLPFAALTRSDRPDSRFLIQDYVLAYVPTAAALRPPPGDRAAGSALVMAPARARLRWSEQEAAEVARFFPVNSRLLVGHAATKDSFKRLAGDYDILHLATHSYLNRYAPLLSSLEMESDGQDDGELEVFEILQLKLHASLVTLSACETALGSGYFSDIPAGDEFVGLTRAFLSAGAHSVVATLWQVNDRSTLDFMEQFYRDREKAGNATALSMAQRDLAASEGPYRHPYYWAPFVLVGK